jgi:hypothetical protein
LLINKPFNSQEESFILTFLILAKLNELQILSSFSITAANSLSLGNSISGNLKSQEKYAEIS